MEILIDHIMVARVRDKNNNKTMTKGETSYEIYKDFTSFVLKHTKVNRFHYERAWISDWSTVTVLLPAQDSFFPMATNKRNLHKS